MLVLLLLGRRWTEPCSVKTGDNARARVFVIAQLIHMPLLSILPRRAPRTAGQPECRTPIQQRGAHERAGMDTNHPSLSRSGRHAEAKRREVGQVEKKPAAAQKAAAR